MPTPCAHRRVSFETVCVSNTMTGTSLPPLHRQRCADCGMVRTALSGGWFVEGLPVGGCGLVVTTFPGWSPTVPGAAA